MKKSHICLFCIFPNRTEVVDTLDESIKSIQETIVENPVGKRARTENDNFEMSRSRIRPPSPLPWSSERRAVHYSRFKKLKTENSDDNRTKYLANELDIRHDTSNPDDEAREQGWLNEGKSL